MQVVSEQRYKWPDARHAWPQDQSHCQVSVWFACTAIQDVLHRTILLHEDDLAVCLRQTNIKGKRHYSVGIAMQTLLCRHHCADTLPVHNVALMDVDQGTQQRSQHLARNEALCQALPTHTQQSLMDEMRAGRHMAK